MAALALLVGRGRDDPGLRPAVQLLAGFMALVALLLMLDASRWSAWGDAILPALPLLMARHIEQLARIRAPRRGDVGLAASGALALPYLLLPPAVHQQLAAGVVPALDPRGLVLIGGAAGLFWLCLVAATVWAGLRILRALRRHHAVMVQIIAQPPTRRLDGVAALSLFLALIFGLQLLDLLSLGAALTGPVTEVFLLVLILGASLHGLTLRGTLPDWTDDLVTTGQPAAAAGPQYARSGLDEARRAQLLARIDAAMTRGALWRSADLSLADLASAAGAKPFYVSQALNQGRAESFFDYVNRHRVREAQKLLRETDAPVLEIAFAVGFNAKSTFNSAFRKLCGTTPSLWRASGPAGPDAQEDRA